MHGLLCSRRARVVVIYTVTGDPPKRAAVSRTFFSARAALAPAAAMERDSLRRSRTDSEPASNTGERA